MKWFKHSTDSHDDPDISDAMDEFGQVGYSAFFILLEIYGKEFNHLDKDGWLTLSRRFVARKLRISSTKVEKLLNFYSERQRIAFKMDGNRVVFNIPQFIEIASNWTKRQGALPTEHLQRHSVAPTAREVEVEVEVEVEDKLPCAKKRKDSSPKNVEFNQFWQAWPKKKSKESALKAWKQTAKIRPNIKTIISIIEKLKTSDEWTKEGGQFIPYPATWLRAGGWDDEVNLIGNPFDEFTKGG